MVTQLYTPNIRQIARLPQNAGHFGRATKDKSIEDTLPETNTENQSEQKTTQRHPQDNGGQQNSQHQLSTLKEHQQKGQISIGSILQDFQKTLDSLQAPPAVIEELTPYFQVIAHQAKQDNPASKLIRQHLQFAAKLVDNYIGKSLGQPSNVVREWIDALLIQPINYNSSDALSDFRPPSIQTPLNDETKALIKQHFVSGQLALKQKDIASAKTHFEVVTEQLETHKAPATISAKTAYYLGKIARLNQDAPEAIIQFEKSLTLLSPLAPHPMQGKLQMTLANLYNTMQQPQSALQKVEDAITNFSTLENTTALTQAHRLAGDLNVTLGDYSAAQTHYETALSQLEGNDTQAHDALLASLNLRMGLNLIKQEQPQEALKLLLSGYQLTATSNIPQERKRIGETLAKLFLDMGQNDNALAILRQISA